MELAKGLAIRLAMVLAMGLAKGLAILLAKELAMVLAKGLAMVLATEGVWRILVAPFLYIYVLSSIKK